MSEIDLIATIPVPADRLPAVALSAFARDADRPRARQAGYQAHIGKPADPVELLSQIAALLQARGTRPPPAPE